MPDRSAEFPFDIIGFDLDGTLVDSSGDIANAVNHSLALADRAPLTRMQIETMIGGGAKHLLTQALDASGGVAPEDFRRFYKAMLAHYAAHIADETRPFPGTIEAVDSLLAMGVKCAIVTNKFESLAQDLLQRLGIRDRFCALIGGDTMGKGFAKPHRAPIDEMIRQCGGGHAAFIGDSVYDIDAARNAGIMSVAVGFGGRFRSAEGLGADAVIGSFAGLIDALRRLG